MPIVKSKFRSWIYVIIGILLLALGLFSVVILFITDRPEISPLAAFMMLSPFVFLLVWLIYGELRTRAVVVWIDADTITVTAYVGLGRKRIYRLTEFDGFNTIILPSRYDQFEYLYLMKNGKRMVKMSEFYHSNYYDLKSAIRRKVLNLGELEYNFIREIKEMFR